MRRARPRARRHAREPASGLSDLAYFDNMLAADEAARRKKHAFMLRVFDAAVLLGTDAVCGFVGRNPQLSMDENLVMFEEEFVPLLQEAKARGLTYRVEQCPMPGWNDERQLAQQHRLRARVRGSRCTGSARSTASATSSASTTIRRTPSSWARTRARSSST